ncbi:MAG TPA: alpha-amylase family protein [Acidobacteriota bacterium]|nr:alpha-amylase family protein [Acidobacteriota bacterium]
MIRMFNSNKARVIRLVFSFLLAAASAVAQQPWKPSTDWGHWRLGHRAELDFLIKNNLTITFGSGAPNFESVSRKDFDKAMEKAKADNEGFHDKGYIVLRYLSTSLGGTSDTGESSPRRDQIRMLKFYNENWKDFEDYIGPKPDDDPTTWITVRPDGTFPFYRYAPYGRKPGKGFETWGCPNNPYYARMMEGSIRAQAETGIDGSYVDWTQIAGGTCYCRYCLKNFGAYLERYLPREVAKAKYGITDYAGIRLPEKRGEPLWMEFVMFRYHTVAEFHKRLREAARKYNPHFMISGNVFGGFGYGPIAYDAAGNMEMLGRDGYDDFVYSEIQEYLDSAPRKDEKGTKITNGPALKFLAAATHGKPVIEYAIEITPPIFPNPAERCLSAMSQINIAEAVANHCVFREKRETPPGATQIYRFLAANEDKLLGQQLFSNVGILTSLRQYMADELSFSFSASRVLADRGIAHVMVTEDDLLRPSLSSFDLIVVPYLPLLSAGHQKALVDYAARGGTVLILGNSGAKDEYNLPQKLVALAAPFGGSYPQSEAARKVGAGKLVFAPLTVPLNRFLISMKSKGEYTTFGPTMADVFADIPEGYTRNRIDPALRQVLEKLADTVTKTLGPRITRLAAPSPYVEVTAMLDKAGNRMLLHIVNYDVTVDGEITPARGLKVQVALPPHKKVRSVTFSGTLSEMKPLKYQTSTQDKRTLVFDLDQVNVYGLAVIEFE